MCVYVLSSGHAFGWITILSLVMSQTTLGLVRELLGELQRSSDAELETPLKSMVIKSVKLKMPSLCLRVD